MSVNKSHKIIFTVIGVIIGLLMAMLISPLLNKPNDVQVDHREQKIERKVLFWYDPMNPATKFDKPGPSPFMDMDLIPKYADEEEGVDSYGVTINPTQVQNLGLRTDIAEMGQLTYKLNLPANITYNQYQYEIVHARASGFVEKSYPLAIGDYVNKGDPLIDITVTDWIAAQSEYLTLLKTNASQVLLNGVRERLYLAGMPNELIDKLAATHKIQSYLTIKAPISGVLTSFDLRSGMTMSKSATIATIQGIDPVWIVASVPESLTNLLTVGNPSLHVAIPSLPNRSFAILDWQLLANAQENTRTITLRLFVANPEHKLKPGMTATVQLQAESKPYLLIPSQAIIDTGDEQRVIVQDSQGKLIPRQVEIYAEANGKTALISGLNQSEKVVTSGLFLIDSEANINGALERMRQQLTVHHDQADNRGSQGEQP